jgi:hypothetical protein
MVVVVGLKRPEREDDRRSRWSSLGGAVLVRSTRAGARHGLTDHLPARRGLLDRVRLERAGAHRDPRLHGRAMSALRPGAWAPGRRTLTSGRRAISGPRAPHGRTVRLTRESVGRGSPYRARPGGTWEVSAWRRPIRSVVMVRSERFPARGCRSNERATGRRPACPYLEEVKLLRRPAPLGSGRAGAGSRPASARPCASLGSAAGVLAGGDERIEGDIEGCGVEQAGEPAVQVGEQVDLAQVDGARMVEQSAGPRGR